MLFYLIRNASLAIRKIFTAALVTVLKGLYFTTSKTEYRLDSILATAKLDARGNHIHALVVSEPRMESFCPDLPRKPSLF